MSSKNNKREREQLTTIFKESPESDQLYTPASSSEKEYSLKEQDGSGQKEREGTGEGKQRSRSALPPRLDTDILKRSTFKELKKSKSYKGLKPKSNKRATAIIMVIILASVISLGIYWFMSEKRLHEGEIRAYGAVCEKVFQDYQGFVQELGDIGNQVYLPDKSGFEKRRSDAFERINDLEMNLIADIELMNKTSPPSDELNDVNDYMIRSLTQFKEEDLEELKEFVETLDPNLAAKMMSGYLSQTPFKRAVSVSDESSSNMEKALDIWYNESSRL